MKRFFRNLTAGITLLALSTQIAVARFSDTVHTAYNDAYTYLSQQGIIHGYPDGTGRPGAFLNRAEALKVVIGSVPEYQQRSEYYTANMPPISLFKDVKQDQWYAAYVEAAFEKRLVTGYPDGTFRPANRLTVEEAVTLLLSLIHI